ncbi:hypothetical protein JW613_34540 [Streptomyces smyrnaeus]|uniref:Heparin binding hemagglutinin HbhA n=1 Tax=Streptomyces smyrnaeus TaxID=1387713 RepID=A0ABS3Y799_9ACTN|nr:hypothetical protein [Streptomyces smyrnaeus]MBO8203363.1 hypothetical protein [Streptomyces smyrnaeus]
MPLSNDLRKTLTDPKPLYVAAGVVDKIREEAPQALAAVREADPKEVQAKLTQQAKETQAKVGETLTGLDTDIKKLREQAQHLALQSVGVAAEYAIKARETYDELAVRGREAVKNWRGESDDDTPEVTVEREPAQSVKIAEPPAEETSGSAAGTGSKSTGATGTSSSTGGAKSSARKSAAGATKSSSGNGTRTASGAKKTTAARKTNGTSTPAARKSAPKTDS